MKMWLAGFGAVVLIASSALASSHAQVPVKDAAGKTYAVLVFCNDCENPAKSGCFDGSESGWLKGKPCGKCFLEQGPKTTLPIPHDMHITGKITNAKGEPVKERFVKLFMTNGWGHKTRTFEDGRFHLMLGATGERQGKEVIEVDVGTLVDSVGENDEFFAFYMLAPDFKPCTSAAPAKAAK